MWRTHVEVEKIRSGPAWPMASLAGAAYGLIKTGKVRNGKLDET
jgi:hypothetical protein